MTKRNLVGVIQRILDVIPLEETKLRKALDFVARDAVFTAPELMQERWFQCHDMLTTYITPGTYFSDGTNWQSRVFRIFTDNE